MHEHPGNEHAFKNDKLYELTLEGLKTKKELLMGSYTLKSIGKNTDYMTIVREMDDGYVVRIVRDKDGYTDVTTDYMSKTLFDSCIRTGYIEKIDEPESRLAANA